MLGTSAVRSSLSPREWALAVLLTLAFVPALVALAGVWTRVDYQSHGFLVPVVSLWVLLRERNRWPGLEARSDPRGLFVVGLALAVYLLGLAAGEVSVQGLALVAAIAGAVWFARGPAWLRQLAFPIAFLIFMVPVPASWTTPLIVKLQLFVSSASLSVLHALGAPIAREGNVMYLPSGDSLFVAEACSGVTSIITLAPLGVLLAYYTLRRPLSRALLVLAVIPLAMVGNLTRVVVVTLAALQWGVAVAAEGPAHDMAGLLTYSVACLLLIATSALLHRFERRGTGSPVRNPG